MNCPHCKGAGISGLATRWSSREASAKCSLCGGLSHVIASSGSGIPAFSLAIVLAFTIVGAIQGALLLGALAGVPFALAYNVWAWQRAELFPISPERAASARRIGWFINLLAILGIFVS